MTELEAEELVILIAKNGSHEAAAPALGCSRPRVTQKFKVARELLGDDRTLALITLHQRDAESGVTLRKPFVMATGRCGVCGGEKVRNPSGQLRCNACRNARYRADHPLPEASTLTPEEVATQFVTVLAQEGSQAAAAKVLGISQPVVSERLQKARKLLGDDRVIALLKANLRDPARETNLLKPFIINKPVCLQCGGERKPSPSTGELVCRTCANRRNETYKKKHPARVMAGRAEYREKYRDQLLEKGRRYRALNPEVYEAYYQQNVDRIKDQVKAYRSANKHKIRDYVKRRLKEDPAFSEATRARLRAWKKRNPHKVNADTARRQLRLKQAYTAWADDDLITQAYELAQRRTKATGIAWEVDHIVPLTSDLVCGLHWEGNLQVIPAAANLAKKNFWWPQMPGDDAYPTFQEQPSRYT